MKQLLYGVLAMLVLSGCAKLQHLDQLLMLKDMSDEKERMDQHVEKQLTDLNLLIEAIEQNRFENYTTKKSIAASFGQPLLENKVSRDGQTYLEWVYRHPTKYFKTEKVYIYFDFADTVVDWAYYDAQGDCLRKKNIPHGKEGAQTSRICPLAKQKKKARILSCACP